MAVTEALMLTVGTELFALPLSAVNSIVSVASRVAEHARKTQKICIDNIERPFVCLRDYLGFADDDQQPESFFVAILKAGAHQVALQVEGVLPGRDIVVKPIDSEIASATGLVGATILDDGVVVPILDPTKLVTDTVPRSMSGRADASRRPLVMVVDDSLSVRSVLTKTIRHAGWSPITARDGAEALEMLAKLEQPPDVFCLDIEMPRIDGYALLQILRQEEMYAETPVVMITSRSGDKHRQQAFNLGASAYVTKPVRDDVLIHTIRRQLSHTGSLQLTL
jgi:chemosensory pili system protein ChpA (sensor histidine kinase/response regulator)